MGVSAAIMIGSMVVGQAVSNMAPTPGKLPDFPENIDKEGPAADAVKRARRQPRGGRSGTIMTSPSGIENGQSYSGNTLLGG